MRRSIVALGALGLLAGCGDGAEPPAANKAAAKAEAPAKKRPTYCFFKNPDTKGWSASRDAAGNVAVKGQARIGDRRYMASLSEWDSAGATSVTVLCGKKVVAELPLKKR